MAVSDERVEFNRLVRQMMGLEGGPPVKIDGQVIDVMHAYTEYSADGLFHHEALVQIAGSPFRKPLGRMHLPQEYIRLPGAPSFVVRCIEGKAVRVPVGYDPSLEPERPECSDEYFEDKSEVPG